MSKSKNDYKKGRRIGLLADNVKIVYILSE